VARFDKNLRIAKKLVDNGWVDKLAG
jgi:hypothetical protein